MREQGYGEGEQHVARAYNEALRPQLPRSVQGVCNSGDKHRHIEVRDDERDQHEARSVQEVCNLGDKHRHIEVCDDERDQHEARSHKAACSQMPRSVEGVCIILCHSCVSFLLQDVLLQD